MLLFDGRLPVLAVVLAEAGVILGLDVRLFRPTSVRIRLVVRNWHELFFQLLLLGIVESRNNLNKKKLFALRVVMLRMGSHHHQVAILVLDDKLDCFDPLENFFSWCKKV